MELSKDCRQSDEVLARSVVQVSGDFLAFFVLQRQKPARKPLEFFFYQLALRDVADH